MIYLSHYIRRWAHFLEEKTKVKVNKKKIWNVFRILLILVIVLGGIGWTRYMRVKEFKYYDVKSESDLYNNLVGYKSGEGKMFLYSNDGARALDS